MIQILEVDHISALGDFDYQKFSKKKNILNDVSKPCRFYEFVLIDNESIQISHIKNTEGTNIAYSKFKNFKNYFRKGLGTKSFYSLKIFTKFCSSNF